MRASEAGAREARVSVVAEATSEPIRLAADAELVVQILKPLLENAVRHAATTVRIGVDRVGADAVRILVQDDGPGIGPADAEHVFEPGWQTAGGSGSGLGLALARRIARSQGGEVRVGEADRGALLVVELPTIAGPAPA